MSQEKTYRPRVRRSSVDVEEEKAWVSFYRRVGNPDVAMEVMHQLDSDAEMKRQHLALYLRCRESLRAQKARHARHQRIGQFVRMLSGMLFITPAFAIRKLLRHSGAIAVECLPEMHKEPGVRQVRNLTRDAEFAQAQSAFEHQPTEPALRPTKAERAMNRSAPAATTGNEE